MKKHLVKLFTAALMLLVIMLGRATTSIAFENVLTSPLVTRFDKSNGDWISGPQFSDEYSYYRLAYRGEIGNMGLVDSSVTTSNGTVQAATFKAGGVIDRPSDQHIEVGSVLRVKNIGAYKGKPLVLAITPIKYPLDVNQHKTDGGLNPKVTTWGPIAGDNRTHSAQYDFWIEYDNPDVTVTSHVGPSPRKVPGPGKILNDPNAIFLYSAGMNLTSTAFNYNTVSFASDTRKDYFIVDNQTSQIDVEKNSTMFSSRFPRTNDIRYYTYGMAQLGSRSSVIRTANSIDPLNSVQLNADYLLSPTIKTGIKIPYQKPEVIATKNDRTDGQYQLKADLQVVQALLSQSYDVQYPYALQIVIDLGEYIKPTPEAIMVTTSKGTYLPGVVSSPTSGPNANKIVVTIPRNKLKELGDSEIYIKGLLPIDIDKPGVFDEITPDGYLKLKNVTAENNENTKQSSNDLLVKVPGPTGSPVPNIAVLQGTKSETMTPETMVTNLQSVIPGDTVSVVGFKANKTFNNVPNDSIDVVIKSQRTGMTTNIPVPVRVFGKELDILSPVNIITEDNKVATKKSELTYQPIFEEVIKQPTGTTLMDKLKITATYADYLNVKESDFKVFVGTTELSPTKYNKVLDSTKKEFSVTFKNSAINSDLVGKTLRIEQKSQMKTDDKNILNSSIYNAATQTFTYPITAYYSFGETSSNAILTQSPISKKDQVIKYKPNILAKGIAEKTVDVKTPVGNPEDYIVPGSLSPVDFEFDEHVISFETQPNFDNVGTEKFNIDIRSKHFGTDDNATKVPIVVHVAEPLVEMSVKQIYVEDSNKAIYKDLENKIPVANDVKENVRKGDQLEPIIKKLIADKKFTLNYDWYVDIKEVDYKVKIGNNPPISTNIVPSENFEIIFSYRGILNVSVTDLDYEKVETTSSNHKKDYLNKSMTGKNQDIQITNTTLNPNWELSVALPDGITKKGTTKPFLGGLEFNKTVSDPAIDIDDKGVIYTKENSTSANQKLVTKVPMTINLYQNIGNDIGKYSGEMLWTLKNAP